MRRRGFLHGVAATIAFLSAAASGLGAVVTNVCSKVAPVKRRILLPPVPKWDKATDGIDGVDYLRRSEDLERSFLPQNLVFPREGQVWVAVRDCEVFAWKPTTQRKRTVFGGKVQLRKGEPVRILPLDHPKPLQVRFQRLRVDEASYVISMRMARTVPGQSPEAAYFNELFRLMET